MSDHVSQGVISTVTDNDSIIPGFHPIEPDSRDKQDSKKGTDIRIYEKNGGIIVNPIEKEMPPKLSVFKATLMLTNICVGATIFTFAVRVKSFGLVWYIVACILTGIINYWTIMRGTLASSRRSFIKDYSLLTLAILGKKSRFILNIFIILYSYGCMMCFFSLLFPLFGRFIQNIADNNKYNTYEEFEKLKWGKTYIKFFFFIVMIFVVAILCATANINKLKYSSHIAVAFMIYSLLVVMIQCSDYYNYYKKTKYIKEDNKTHPNWFNLSKAFTKDLDFFKGMTNLFCSYACHPGMFPIFEEFKGKKNGEKKMRYSVFFSTCLTTVLYIISIVCSFLTDPITPEDLIVYRNNKGNGKDIAMSISKLFVALYLILTMPEYFYNLRLNVENTFIGDKMTGNFRYIFTFLSCIGCAVIGAFYDKVLNYISYIGGFIAVFICYLYPILIYVFSTEKKLKYWKNVLEIILAVILCIIGVIGGIATIIDDVKK